MMIIANINTKIAWASETMSVPGTTILNIIIKSNIENKSSIEIKSNIDVTSNIDIKSNIKIKSKIETKPPLTG